MDSVVVLVVWVEGSRSLTVVQAENVAIPVMVRQVMIMFLIFGLIYLSVVVVVVVFDSCTWVSGSITVLLTTTFEATRLSPSFT